jgi:hypothetical protein
LTLKTTRTVEAALDSDPLDTKTTRTVEAPALDSDPLDADSDDSDRRGGQGSRRCRARGCRVAAGCRGSLYSIQRLYAVASTVTL